MIILYKNGKPCEEFRTKGEFNKYIRMYAKYIGEVTETDEHGFLWDMFWNDAAYELPVGFHENRVTSITWQVADTTGEYHREPYWWKGVN